MTKSGDKFDAAIQYLKTQTNISQLAETYAGLRTRLVCYQLQHLEGVQEVYARSVGMESHTLFSPQPFLNDDYVSADMMLDCIDLGSD